MNSCWLAVFLVMSVWALSASVSGNMEHELIAYLKTVAKNARPVKNSSDVVYVTYAMSVNSFLVDEQHLTLTSFAYETLKWPAEVLMWDPKSYNGINTVVLANEDLWIPDISTYNRAGGRDVQHGQSNVRVHSSGNATLIRTTKTKVNCEVDSLRFPYETLNCTQILGSWVYTAKSLDLVAHNESVDFKDLTPNPKWALKAFQVYIKKREFPSVTHPTIVYKIQFDRDSTQYFYVLLLPCFLLLILTILLFLIPIHSPGRITLGGLLFCAFFALLLYTSTLVVVSTQYPYFVRFLVFNLFVITLFTFLNSIIVKLSNSEDGQDVPMFLRTLMFTNLARLFNMKSIVQRNQSQPPAAPKVLAQPGGSYNKLSLTGEKPLLDPQGATTDNLPEIDLNGKRSLEENVASIRDVTTHFAQHKTDGNREKTSSKQWDDLATVLNMLFFIIYITMAIISVVVVYIQVSMD